MSHTERLPDSVTASEIAEWIFCPEAWRLARIGNPSVNQPLLAAGKEHHGDLATVETKAGVSISHGRFLIVLALLALAVAWILSR